MASRVPAWLMMTRKGQGVFCLCTFGIPYACAVRLVLLMELMNHKISCCWRWFVSATSLTNLVLTAVSLFWAALGVMGK